MTNHLENYFNKYPQQKRSSAAIAYLAGLDEISRSSPEIAQSIIQELEDQRSYVKLIASENYSSYAVQLAMGNWLTDKYAEGYPHHRFYAGCQNVDAIEERACQELKKLFNAECAYVQPHSGADANLVAFWSILINRVQNKETQKLGKKSINEMSAEEYESVRQLLVNQKIMGMSLNSGGHLTHGYLHNLSSKMMKAVYYDVDPNTHLLDYGAIAEKAKAEKPLILLAGYSAHPRKINFAKMREIADSIDAVLMVDMAHFSGLVAGKAFTGEFNPIPYAHIVTSTTHKTLRGPRGGFILCQKEFEETVNKGCPIALGGPLPHVMAAKAIAFAEANTPEFGDYAARVIENAQALAARFVEKGVPIVTGGTENHMVIVNVASFGLTGLQAEAALREAHLTLNRNAIPFDSNGPWFTSGIRIGSPAITTLGMGPNEMNIIADTIMTVLKNTKPSSRAGEATASRSAYSTDSVTLQDAQQQIKNLLTHYPLYPEVEICRIDQTMEISQEVY